MSISCKKRCEVAEYTYPERSHQCRTEDKDGPEVVSHQVFASFGVSAYIHSYEKPDNGVGYIKEFEEGKSQT
jgi:hypothetical protein